MVTKEIVEKFGNVDGIGQKLQQKLEERRKTTDNWVSLNFYHVAMQNTVK